MNVFLRSDPARRTGVARAPPWEREEAWLCGQGRSFGPMDGTCAREVTRLYSWRVGQQANGSSVGYAELDAVLLPQCRDEMVSHPSVLPHQNINRAADMTSLDLSALNRNRALLSRAGALRGL